MASITGMIPAEALVLREGQQKRVPAAELVIGDIIYVTLGNKCPADFRILECSGDLKFDRSVLTGESNPISGTTKNTDPNFMESHNIGMQGTHVVSGNCVGLVIQTGDLTVFGRIAKLSSSERNERTTLQKVPLSIIDCADKKKGNSPFCVHYWNHIHIFCHPCCDHVGCISSTCTPWLP
jgi:sodium/potassium-transporting ATPase subunit alpha